MPGFDGTGPRGMGPMTGGGRGFCSPWGIGAALRSGVASPYAGTPYPFYGRPGPMPFYRGYGSGQPWVAPGASPYTPQMTREQELEFLRDQAQMMGEQLERIQKRVQELEAE